MKDNVLRSNDGDEDHKCGHNTYEQALYLAQISG
jgi:hypothetical protein